MARLTAASVLLALGVVSPAAAFEPGPAERRGKAFWTALVEDCRPPSGESAFGLVSEALALLGSPASAWRDDVGYVVVASCAYRQRRLTADERRAIVARLAENLRRGIGEQGTPSVLLRSFSALDLSVFAALENDAPALDAAGYRRLLDQALSYLRDERDLRGFAPELGWIHATAHAADLLKFLARDMRLTGVDQVRLLDQVRDKLIGLGTPVFTHGEDERLAAAVASIIRRADFDPALLDPWLEGFVSLEQRVWSTSPPDPQLLDAAQNARNLLRSLYVILSLPVPAPAPGAQGVPTPAPAPPQLAAREKLLATLARIRR